MKNDQTIWQKNNSNNLLLHIYPKITPRECTLLHILIWIMHFACAREGYKVTNTEHYHIAIRLNPSQRWKITKEFLHEKHGIVSSLAFSPNGDM